jgi:uncharacterized RmlC-like cupin family protein
MLDRTQQGAIDWKTIGIKVVKREAKSCDTPDTKGMNRQVALSGSQTGSVSLWAGTNHIKPGELTGAHHHGHLESVIYIISGHALMRWGEKLEYITAAGPGDFLQVPAWLPHQELNASDTEDLHCALVRSGPEEVVVNLDLDIVDKPEWIDF